MLVTIKDEKEIHLPANPSPEFTTQVKRRVTNCLGGDAQIQSALRGGVDEGVR